MAERKICIYKSNGALLGYFRDPQINQFSQGEYEIKGMFHSADGSLPTKLDFNPQISPYWASMEEIVGANHKQLTNVYIQRGRQPVVMTALGNNT